MGLYVPQADTQIHLTKGCNTYIQRVALLLYSNAANSYRRSRAEYIQHPRHPYQLEHVVPVPTSRQTVPSCMASTDGQPSIKLVMLPLQHHALAPHGSSAAAVPTIDAML